MKYWLIVMLLALASPLVAQDEEKPAEAGGAEEEEAEEERGPVETTRDRLKDIGDVIDSVTFDKKDMKSYLDERRAFNDAMSGDEKFDELRDENLKKSFDHAISSENYKTWAAERELDADDWLRKLYRIDMLFWRWKVIPKIEKYVKRCDDSLEKLEKNRDEMDDDEYAAAKEEGEASRDGWKELLDIAKGLPEPTDDEEKLLDKNEKKIEE